MAEVSLKKRQKIALVFFILSAMVGLSTQDHQGDYRLLFDVLIVSLGILCLGFTWTDPFGENDEGQG